MERGLWMLSPDFYCEVILGGDQISAPEERRNDYFRNTVIHLSLWGITWYYETRRTGVSLSRCSQIASLNGYLAILSFNYFVFNKKELDCFHQTRITVFEGEGKGSLYFFKATLENMANNLLSTSVIAHRRGGGGQDKQLSAWFK